MIISVLIASAVVSVSAPAPSAAAPPEEVAVSAAPLREQIVLGKIGEVSTLATNGLATLGSQINCLAAQVAGITKTVVPISSVCPQPMPQYNSWTAPTAAATT